MDVKTDHTHELSAEKQVQFLYNKLIDSWNKQNANEYASLFTSDGNVIGFDGSQANGQEEIHSQLSEVFNHHKTAAYVSMVREIRPLDPIVWLLRAVAGMVPPGQSDINPAVNVIQTLIAVKVHDDFKIVLFQNTPAQFHGRPDLADQLTKELRTVLHNSKISK